MSIEELPIDLLYDKFLSIHERWYLHFNSYDDIKKELLKPFYKFHGIFKYIIRNLDKPELLRTIKFSKETIIQTYCYILPMLCELKLYWKTNGKLECYNKEIILQIIQHKDILTDDDKEYIEHMLKVEIYAPYDRYKICILDQYNVINKYLLFRGKHLYDRAITDFIERERNH